MSSSRHKVPVQSEGNVLHVQFPQARPKAAQHADGVTPVATGDNVVGTTGDAREVQPPAPGTAPRPAHDSIYQIPRWTGSEPDWW